jgi:hypothetical protein
MKTILSVLLSASLAFGQATVSGGNVTGGNVSSGVVDIGLHIDFYIAPATATPPGNDSNPCTKAQPCLTPQHVTAVVRGMPSGKRVVALRGGDYFMDTPWTFTSADSGTTLRPIIYESYPGEQAVITGGNKLPHTFVQTGSINCGGSCVQWKFTSASGTYGNYEALWYCKTGQECERRFRPVLGVESNGYSTEGANNQPAYDCVPAAQASAACPAGNQARCSTGQVECADRMNRDAAVANPDNQTSFHGVSGTALIGGAITGLHEVVSKMGEDGWTFADSRLTPTGGDATNPCTLSATKLCMTGKWTNALQHGPRTGNRYLLENVFEKLGVGANGPGQWYLDKDANSDGVQDANNVLTYLAKAGENPNVDTIIVPQRTQLLVLTDVQNVLFRDIRFGYTKYEVPTTGQPAVSHAANLSAGISCTRCAVKFDFDTFAHSDPWVVEFIGTAAPGVGSIVTNSAFFDLGTGAIRLGQTPGGSDSDSDVSQYNTIKNNKLRGGQRVLPGGIGLAVWIGNSHHNTVEHNEINDWYSGAIGVGATLNNPSTQGIALAHDNKIRYNLIYDIGQGVTSDHGALHTATSGTTGNEFCYNIVHDVTHDLLNGGHDASAIYLDQGSSNWKICNNLTYRVSTANFFVNNPFGMVNNTVTNNIFAYGKKGLVRKNLDDCQVPGACKVFDVQHNIFYFDKGNGAFSVQVDGSKSQWQPVGVGITAVATFDFNTYFNFDVAHPLSSNPRAFYTTDGTQSFNPSCNGVGSGCTPAQWQALGEDPHSTFGVNPGFVGPSFAQGDNYAFSGAPPPGFSLINFSQIGTSGPLPSIPATVAPGFPLQLLDKATDF